MRNCFFLSLYKMHTSKTLPIYQLEAVMNLDNVYGMDEIIGDPIHVLGGTEETQKNTFNWWWILLLFIPILIFFLIYKFNK